MKSYTPRRQSKRWLDADCPRGVLAIYAGGNTYSHIKETTDA